MELREYVRILRRNWLLVLTCVLLGGLLAATASWRQTKVYAASVTMVVSSSDEVADAASAYQGGLLSEQRVKSYAGLVASERVAAAVIDRLDLTEDPSVLRARIQAQAVPDTVLLRASVRDVDPLRAQMIADAIGAVFSDAVDQIERPAEDEPSTVRVRVWEHAKLPTTPVSPQPTRSIALGVLLGLLAGVVIGFIRHRLDTSIAGDTDAAAVTGLATLGMIGYDSDASRRPLIVHLSPHSRRAEAFRQIRTNLQFVDVDTRPRSLLVTSSVPEEGKTTTACNLAITLAQGGARVCLVEGDLRRPSFGDYLGIESAAGLTSVLIGAADLDDVLQPWGEGRVGDGRVEILPSGPIPPNPSELLGSRNMAELLDVLDRRFDTVLIDAPPLLPVTDAAVLATMVDGVLLVARSGRTRREQLRRAAEALRAVDANLIGTILTMIPTKGPNADYYGRSESYAPRLRHTSLRQSTGTASATADGKHRADSATDRTWSAPAVPAVPAVPTQTTAAVPSTDARSTTSSGGPSAGAPTEGAATSATARPAGTRAAKRAAAARKAATRAAAESPTTLDRRAGRGGPRSRGQAASSPADGGEAAGHATAGPTAGSSSATDATAGEATAGGIAANPPAPAPQRLAAAATDPGSDSGRAEGRPAVEIAQQRQSDDHTAPLAYGPVEHPDRPSGR